MLEPMDDLPIASLTPDKDATLLGEPQEAQVIAACPPEHEVQANEPEDASKPMETATESQGI